jgi:hypothetical protein
MVLLFVGRYCAIYENITGSGIEKPFKLPLEGGTKKCFVPLHKNCEESLL